MKKNLKIELIQEENCKSLSERVAESLSKLITQRNLRPGDKIPNEFELAEALNVGRGTVREAVKLLVSQNVLEIKRGKGTYVTDAPGTVVDPWGLEYIQEDTTVVVELLELREHWEPWIIRAAAERATDAEIAHLREIFDRLDPLVRAGNSDSIEIDSEFHNAIAACSHNSLVYRMAPAISLGVRYVTKITKKGTQSGISDLSGMSSRTHREMLEAIAAHNPDRAETAMNEHIQMNKKKLLSILTKREGFEVTVEGILKNVNFPRK